MKINPKQLEKMAKRMGIQASPIEAKEVIIRTQDKEIVISNPQVSKVNMMGQETWQITGEAEERPNKPFTSEDIDTVINQTGATREEVEDALEAAHGDLAEAIMKIKEKEK
jgi:nascent polypeptide-associated complex subunit alpha